MLDKMKCSGSLDTTVATATVLLLMCQSIPILAFAYEN